MAQEPRAKPRAARVLSLARGKEIDSDLAERLGVSPQHVGNWRAGRHDVSLDLLVRISKKTGADLMWLLTGETTDAGALQLVTAQEAGELRAILHRAGAILDDALARAGVLSEQSGARPPAGASNLEVLGTLEELTEGEERRATPLEPRPRPTEEGEEGKERGAS